MRFASKSCGFEGRHVLRDSRFFQKVIRKGPPAFAGGPFVPCTMQGAREREGYLFFEKRYPSLSPSQRKFALQACGSKSCGACRLLLAARGEAALSAAIRRLCSYYPLLRSRWRLCCLTDAAHPLGCRSAYLVEVRSNHRLPEHSSMRRAQQCRYLARSPPPSKRHSRLTAVRRGCE